MPLLGGILSVVVVVVGSVVVPVMYFPLQHLRQRIRGTGGATVVG